jgi:hypothetical protein
LAGGGNDKATTLRRKLLADAFEVADLPHDHFNAFQDVLSGSVTRLNACRGGQKFSTPSSSSSSMMALDTPGWEVQYAGCFGQVQLRGEPPLVQNRIGEGSSNLAWRRS